MHYTSCEACLPGINYTSRQVYEYISRQTNDPIVERKTCAISGTQFPIYQSDLDFYTKISPTFAGEKFQIPTPTLCPEERQRRRLSFRNERKLYKRQCDASKKSIISIYSPDKPHKVYDQKTRWSDTRDPMDYGRDFDFSKSFMEQFGELMRGVPRSNLHNTSHESSRFCNFLGNANNCYYCFGGGGSDNMYCTDVSNGIDVESSNCLDCLMCIGLNYSYGCIETHFSHKCIGCYNCEMLYDCINCHDCVRCEFCVGCYNLRNRKYCINNIQYTEEEYKQIIASKAYVKNGLNKGIKKTFHNIKTENCFGNGIRRSNNVAFGFDVFQTNGAKYAIKSGGKGSSDYYDTSYQNKSECVMEGVGGMGYGLIFINLVTANSSNVLYSDLCYGVENCFGCIGLRNKQYCIFNKQYSKEDYEIMVGKIIRHMQTTGERGEFFHPSLSPFGYNETVAQEYYPFEFDGNRRDALVARPQGMELLQDGRAESASLQHDYSQFGYHRSTYSSDPKIPDGVKTIDCRLAEWAEDSPARKQLNMDVCNASLQQNYVICKQIILCEQSGRPFMLQKAEIDFYRKHHISLPRKHPDIRHEERMKLRPGRTLYLRNCDCCGKEMLSVYSQEHEGKVYCESCYQKEIYS